MVSAIKVHLTVKQRKALLSRARRNGTSLSAEVRKAIDLYLEFPPDFDKETLSALAKEANASLDRSIARLDDAIAHNKMTMERIDELERR